eukprot:5227200-Alexandrium_andersonii.AAC.1
MLEDDRLAGQHDAIKGIIVSDMEWLCQVGSLTWGRLAALLPDRCEHLEDRLRPGCSGCFWALALP